ncbi:MAG: carboxypeptidase-like regulatory domain-containing protein, partial [archaeon]
MTSLLHQIENAWYALLDRIDPIVPIYRIVDPIDKIVPSLYVFVVLILLAGFWVGSMQTVSVIAEPTRATLFFTDSLENPLSGLPVAITLNGKTTSYETDDMGKILIAPVMVGDVLRIHVESNQYESLDDSFSVKKINAEGSFALLTRLQPSQPLLFQLVTTGNQLLEGISLTANVTCPQNPGITALTFPITNGVFHFEPPVPCDAWYASFSGAGYQTIANVLLDSTHPIVEMKPVVYVTGTITATVLSGTTHTPVSGIEVQRYTGAGILAESAFTNEQGIVTFTHVEYGSYYLTLNDSQNKYGGTVGGVFILDSSKADSQTFYVLPVTLGGLTVDVTNATTQQPLEQSLVKIQRKSDGKILASFMTGVNGKTSPWTPAEKDTFNVIVTHDSFLSQTKTVELTGSAAALSFALEPITPQNAASIKVHLTDTDHHPLAGVKLVLYDNDTKTMVASINPLLTDPLGYGTFSGLSPGSYFVRAHKYPFEDVDSNPLLVTGNGTQDVELVLNVSPSDVPEDLLAPPDSSSEGGPTITPCSENCMPLLNVTLSTQKIPAFDPASIIVSVKNGSGNSLEKAHVYVSTVHASGTKTLFASKITNTAGQATVSIPSSMPGMVYSFVIFYPEYEPS